MKTYGVCGQIEAGLEGKNDIDESLYRMRSVIMNRRLVVNTVTVLLVGASVYRECRPTR